MSRSIFVAILVLLFAGEVANAQKMYWTDHANGVIRRANLDGSEVELLVNTIHGSWGIALDLKNGKIYWTIGNPTYDSIWRSNLDGSDVEDFWEALIPFDIELDVQAGKVYWFSGNAAGGRSGRIRRAGIDGLRLEKLVDGFDTFYRSFELDVKSGKMYWVARPSSEDPYFIYRASLDGSNSETVVTLPTANNYWLDIDPNGRKLYWFSTEGLYRSDLDGLNVEFLSKDITQGGNQTFSIDFQNMRVYYLRGGDDIRVADLDGSNVMDITVPGKAWAIAFDNQPQIPALGGIGLGAMAVLVIVAGALLLRRRGALLQQP